MMCSPPIWCPIARSCRESRPPFTMAAARAGVPQVILPHLLDQYYWAHRVAQLGLGPRGLSVELVNADVLTDRVAAALEDPRIGSRAAAFAPLVASRNGVDAAVHHLESF